MADPEEKKETEVPKDNKGIPQVAGSEKKEPEDPEPEDPLLKDLDVELKEKLGDDIYKDYSNYPIRERVSMLRSIAKGIEKAKGIKQESETKPEAKAPATPPAPTRNKPKTLLEANDKEVFFDKLQSKTSFANKAQSWMK